MVRATILIYRTHMSLPALIRKMHDAKIHDDSEVVGYTGNLVFDTTKLDSTLQKLLDMSRLSSLA